MGRRRLKLLVFLSLVVGFSVGSVGAWASFQVSGTELLDAKGNPFIMRGINHPHTWFVQRTEQSLQDISDAGANAVRIVLSDGQRWNRNSAEDVAQVIEWAKDNQLIAVLEVHDVTGSGEDASAGELANTVDYWIDIRSALEGQEDYVVINIANEPFGNGVPASTWVDSHINAIQRLRDAGLTHALLVDAGNWGQDWQGIMLDNASSVAAADELNNTLFSVHMYEVYQSREAVESYVREFLDVHGVPLVIGEFGAEHFGQFVDAESILSVAEEYGVGYLGWSWSGNNAEVAALDITLNWNPDNLSSWGDLLINGENGLKATAETASVFSGSGEDSSGDGGEDSSDDDGSGGDDKPGEDENGSPDDDPDSGGGSETQSGQCSWFGSIHPLCEETQTGWGWENNQSCISEATCSDQPEPYGIVDSDTDGSGNDDSSGDGSGDDGSSDGGSGDGGSGDGAGTGDDSALSSRCEFRVEDEWSSGYLGAIRIVNEGDQSLEGWHLEWEFTDGSQLTNSWNAEVSGNNPYSASNLSWNAEVLPDQFVEFGFQANKGASGDIQLPELTGPVCD